MVSGCATMIRGTRESLQVMSDPPGATVTVSSGEKGTTPCTFLMQRNQSALLKFTKEGYHPESVSVYPTLAGAGVILGGLIDYGTGAVYNLTPNPVNVMLKPIEGAQTARPQETPPPPRKYEPAKVKPAPTECPPTPEPTE
jgi:hypothetical protein